MKKKELLQIRIDGELKSRYLKFCEKNGYTVSKKIRIMIEKELDNYAQTLD